MTKNMVLPKVQNYHKHTDGSNIAIADSPVLIDAYAKRCVEIGSNILSSVEHSYQGRYHVVWEKAKQYGLKFVFGTEAYWVKDRFEKDSSNCHIIILAKNENGRRDINEVLSIANEDGFYKQPRIDVDLIMNKLTPSDVFITSSCIAGWKYEDAEDIWLKIHEKFGSNFMLEVQYHNNEKQKSLNEKILRIAKEHDIKLIMGMDSHYIEEGQSVDRDDLLISKGINYHEDETGWNMDFPDSETCYDRFIEQGVLTHEQIIEAMDNTNITLEFEDIEFDRGLKLPTIFPEKTQKEKDIMYKDIIVREWEKYAKTVPLALHEKYKREIIKEMKVVINTHMSDYFLFNYYLIKNAVARNGIITKTGRGCFTGDALVHTSDGLIPIKEVKIGDYVITKDGNFNKVLNTMKYDIDEELVQIKHLYGTNTKNPTICTLDHKIYINRNGENIWVQAKDINPLTDYVCVPVVKSNDDGIKYIDLVEYDKDGYKYDDEYIYETSSIKEYKYSPSDVAREIDVSKACIEKYANIETNPDYKMFQKKSKEKMALFNEYTGFKTREEYAEYVKDKRTKKIKRFIKIDKVFNEFIGLMYGDGFTCKKNKQEITSIGLAINKVTNKNIYNRNVFFEIAERMNIPTYEHESKTKNLIQLYMNSRVFSNFVSKEMFVSKKGKDKEFNKMWLNQSKDNLKGIIEGLRQSDGSHEEYRISFDNTSNSLINTYKILCLITGEGVNSLQIREKYDTKDGYSCKKSYKLRLNKNSEIAQKVRERTKKDELFYYLPVKEIIRLPKRKETVYDLTVENEHNYLLHNMIVHNSASSFFTNTLLGFSNLDRIVSPVTLYPDRFMSETRILKNNSSPDIDFNTYNTNIFIEEQEKLIGEGHSYPMISYGKLKPKSAFKMYARSQGMNPDLANAISKEIGTYETVYNNADEETKEELSIYDYIDEQYHPYIKSSESYLGIIMDKKISPCSHILYTGDIRREIGIMRLTNKTSKKVVMCACIEGHVADRFGFMKNDILVVSVWGIIENVYKRLGVKSHSINELSKIIENDEKVWEIYSKGLTLCINQCESVGTTNKVMKYKPTNVSELTAFIAGIRPSFKSMYNVFESRKPFKYGVKAFDDLIQTEEMPYSFVLYQEQMMNTLNYAGFDMSECYDIIKAIAKKHPEKVAPLKQQFISGFGKKIKETEFNLTEDEIQENCLKVWKIIEDSAGYGFNSSHALAYAWDSLYCAWLKANHPYEFYAEILQTYSDKGEKDRVVKIIQEMERGFGIKLGAYKFGLDNREFIVDKENEVIYPSLKALKNFNEQTPIDLYNIKDKKFNSFTELLIELTHNTCLDKTKIEALIKLGYFSDFGKNKKLFEIYEQFQKRYKKTHIEKTRLTRKLEMMEFENQTSNESFGVKSQLKNEIELLGYPITKLENAPDDTYLVSEIDGKYSTKTVVLYHIKDGDFVTCKIEKDAFSICPFGIASVMRIPSFYTTKYGNKYLQKYNVIG